MIFTMKLIKTSHNKQYFTNIGIDPDISDALLLYLGPLKGSKKQKYIISKIRKNVDKINSSKGEILSDSKYVDVLFPFEYKDSTSKVMDEAQVDRETAEWALSINTKYSSWVAKLLKNNTVIKGEDDLKIKEKLEEFEQLLNSPTFPKSLREINRYDTFGALARMVEENSDKKSKSQSFKDKAVEGSEKIYDDGNVSVLKITTPEAAATLSKGTEWCVKDPRWAKKYLQGGPLHIFFIGNERVALVQPTSDQIKDIYGDALDDAQIINKIFPIVEKLDLNIYNEHDWAYEDEDDLDDFQTFNRVHEKSISWNKRWASMSEEEREKHLFHNKSLSHLVNEENTTHDIEILKKIFKVFKMAHEQYGSYDGYYDLIDDLKLLKPENAKHFERDFKMLFHDILMDIIAHGLDGFHLQAIADLDSLYKFSYQEEQYEYLKKLVGNAFKHQPRYGDSYLVALIDCIPWYDQIFRGRFAKDPEIIDQYQELAEKLLQNGNIENFNLLNENFYGYFTNMFGSELKPQLSDEKEWWKVIDPHKYEKEDFEELSYASADWYSSFKRTCKK
jgi:hypothetical protein